MRRQGEAATALFRQAMQEDGRRPKPRDVLSLKRPERSVNMPWPEARTTQVRVTIGNIARDVAARHGLTVEDLRCAARPQYLVRARHEAFYLARQFTGASLPQIGRYFHRDHATIINGIRKHAEWEGLK